MTGFGQVNWMTFEQAVERSKKEKRKIFIDVYTDWCGYCKIMDRNTFNDPEVARILNENFYPVKFNAEQRDDVEFDGHVFKFVPAGRYHELAASLLGNKLSYPTVVFLTEDFEIIMGPFPGYRPAQQFHMIAQYIGEDHFRSKTWQEFQQTYKSPYARK